MALTAGPVRVRFAGEQGLDAGGLAKDWVGLIARSLLCKGGYFFRLERAGDRELAHLDPRAPYIYTPSDLEWVFHAIGRFLAKTIQDGHTLGTHTTYPEPYPHIT